MVLTGIMEDLNMLSKARKVYFFRLQRAIFSGDTLI